MKLLHTFCFITIVLGSTAALPIHEQGQIIEDDSSETDIADFTKVEKRTVSSCKIIINVNLALASLGLIHSHLLIQICV